jgi:hypothetical protein
MLEHGITHHVISVIVLWPDRVIQQGIDLCGKHVLSAIDDIGEQAVKPEPRSERSEISHEFGCAEQPVVCPLLQELVMSGVDDE